MACSSFYWRRQAVWRGSLAGAIVLAAVFAGAAEPTVLWPSPEWSSAEPSDVGLDADKLNQARDYALSAGGSGMDRPARQRRPALGGPGGAVRHRIGDQVLRCGRAGDRDQGRQDGAGEPGPALPSDARRSPREETPRPAGSTRSRFCTWPPTRRGLRNGAGTRSSCSSPAPTGTTATAVRIGWPSASRCSTGGTWRT